MKKRVFFLLGGLGLLCGVPTAQAIDQVIIPQGGERWSIGSTVQIEWQLADAETVDLKLVADDDTEYVIVEAIDNTSDFQHFQWILAENVTAGNNQTIQVVSSEDDTVSIESNVINIPEHAEAETFQGNRQDYDEDLSDSARVYRPAEGEVIRLGEDSIVVLAWDDVDHWLLDEVKIELHEHGGTVLDDDTRTTTASYDWQLDDNQCEDTACYFRINSTGGDSDRVVTSGYFTVAGDDVETTAAEAVDCGTDAALEDKTFELGGELIVNWTDETEALGQDLRIELYKGGRYYLLISERELASAGNALSWTIPYTVVEGADYTARVSSRADGTVFGFSDTFLIDSPREEDDLVTMEAFFPDAETEWAEVDDGTVTVEWQDNQNNEDLLFTDRPDDVKLTLYKSERRFKTIFSASLTNSEVLPYANQPEIHDWNLLNTIPSGDDYRVRVLSADEDTGDETDYADSSPFAILAEGLSIIDATSDESAGDATFTVMLSLESEEEVTIDYTSSGGTATEGSDYTAVTGTLTFDEGVTTQTFTVPVFDDSIGEASESVIVELSDPDPADTLIADGTGRLTITDDDGGTDTECPLAVTMICPEDTEDCPQDEDEDEIVLIDDDTTSTSSSSTTSSSTSTS
ncbi:MAG: Ser-Thr-rich GPI-anchored membrane family protein, partial [Pseudomonadota bacterium]|nr:Ser-Thr-rich GPI-anchored membrane family protein [Pseudomonadota bacterium]